MKLKICYLPTRFSRRGMVVSVKKLKVYTLPIGDKLIDFFTNLSKVNPEFKIYFLYIEAHFSLKLLKEISFKDYLNRSFSFLN